MIEQAENSKQNEDPFKPVADILFSYLHDVIYKPSSASLDIESLPKAFGDFGRGLQYIVGAICETRTLAKELALGNLHCPLPPPDNEIASPLKMLHSSLSHLTWQTQQVAKGDYKQRVNFMGDFSLAFNNMIKQLEQRQKNNIDEKTRLEMYVHLILVNCPNPILMFNNHGELAYVSDSFFRHFKKCAGDKVLGKEIHDLFAPIVCEQSLNEIKSVYAKAILEKKIQKTVQEIDFGDPEYSGHYEIQISPMLDMETFEGIIVFLFNVTENVQARLDAECARELSEQSSRSKSNFLAKMSHEIRTPMNAILGMAELALREDVPQVAEGHIITIKQAGITLLSIINDILDISKIEAGKLEIIPINYSFSSLANDVINIIKTKVFESRLRFVAYIDCNIPNELFGDPTRIRQIMLNLLSNAVKYTEKGFISLSIRSEIKEDDIVNIIIEVADSGKGIKKKEVNKLFSEFARFDTEINKNIEGTGLGLAIGQNLTTAMGGQIDVQSEYGKGSVFTVSLPQKIRHSEKIAIVKNKEKKKALIYERRDIYIASITKTMDNLGVNYRIVLNISDFFNCLLSNDYSFVLLASVLYEEIRGKYSGIDPNIRFAVISEYGELITERNISTLNMPIFSIPVTNFLNGVSDSNASYIKKGASSHITAAEAKILVVDDIVTNLEVAMGLLRPYEVQVKLCKSGMEAIEEIKSARYDLVFMDQMMPRMSGIETVSIIRSLNCEDNYYKDVPIIALTADAVSGTREMLLSNGFDDFLSKPIDINKLDIILEKWIPPEKQKNQPIDSFKNTISKKHENEKIEIDGLNTGKGMIQTYGNIKTYMKLLSTFHMDGTSKIKEIKTCIETDDIPLYMIHVHALKSACASIGATELSEAAAALEKAGKKGDLSFIHDNNAAFISDLEKLLNNINTVLSEEAKKSRKTPIDKELLKEELFRLKIAINIFNYSKIENAVNGLQDYAQAEDIGGTVKVILQKILIGEYDEAVSITDAFIQELAENP
jgi:signal transduction histidine kinase/CheY-like chemotaxis protein